MKKLLLACMIFSSMSAAEQVATTRQKALIWDLGGVLTSHSVPGYMSCIGLTSIFTYLVIDMKNPLNLSSTFKDRTFDILRMIEIKEEETFDGACIASGHRMPYVMCAYQAGILHPDVIIPLIDDICEKLSKEDYFESSRERGVIQNTLHQMFTPSTNAYCQYILSSGMELVKNLAAQQDENGNKKYKLFVLSNWDLWSYELVKEKFKELFDCFDDIFISGEIKVIKPMNEAFDIVIKKHSLQKDDCIFIDDQPENITAAQNFGIHNALLFKNYDDLRVELRKLGVELD